MITLLATSVSADNTIFVNLICALAVLAVIGLVIFAAMK